MDKKQSEIREDDFLIKTKCFWKRLGISESEFHKMKSMGRIGPMPVEFGKRTLRWNPREISCWCDYGCPNREAWQPIWNQILQRNGAEKN